MANIIHIIRCLLLKAGCIFSKLLSAYNYSPATDFHGLFDKNFIRELICVNP